MSLDDFVDLSAGGTEVNVFWELWRSDAKQWWIIRVTQDQLAVALKQTIGRSFQDFCKATSAFGGRCVDHADMMLCPWSQQTARGEGEHGSHRLDDIRIQIKYTAVLHLLLDVPATAR